jgi:hypothetical protein
VDTFCTKVQRQCGALIFCCAFSSCMFGCANSKFIEREVTEWVACVECSEEQFGRVRFFGERALPPLVQIIARPRTSSDSEALALRLGDRFETIIRYSSEAHIALEWQDKGRYVEYYRDGLLDLPRLRAAHAILLICRPWIRCDLIRSMEADFRAFMDRFVTKKARSIYVRFIAEYPKPYTVASVPWHDLTNAPGGD